MYGRYGNDALTKFLLVLGLILMIISWFPRLGWVYFLAAAVLVWSLVRSFRAKLTVVDANWTAICAFKSLLSTSLSSAATSGATAKRTSILSAKSAKPFCVCRAAKAK